MVGPTGTVPYQTARELQVGLLLPWCQVPAYLPIASATICVYQILHTSAVLYKFHILPLLIVMTVFIHKIPTVLQILQYSVNSAIFCNILQFLILLSQRVDNTPLGMSLVIPLGVTTGEV